MFLSVESKVGSEFDESVGQLPNDRRHLSAFRRTGGRLCHRSSFRAVKNLSGVQGHRRFDPLLDLFSNVNCDSIYKLSTFFACEAHT